MTSSKKNFSTTAGLLALSSGLAFHLWGHGTFAHFASGFLLGMSIALLILGLARKSRKIPE